MEIEEVKLLILQQRIKLLEAKKADEVAKITDEGAKEAQEEAKKAPKVDVAQKEEAKKGLKADEEVQKGNEAVGKEEVFNLVRKNKRKDYSQGIYFSIIEHIIIHDCNVM